MMLIRILLVFVVLLTSIALPTPIAAQTSESFTVHESDAVGKFPEQITFSLRASSDDAEITSVSLLYGATRRQTLVMVDVPIDAGNDNDIDATYVLNTRVFYFLPGTEITYRWLLRDADGNEFETPPQELIYHDERFPWREREDSGVLLYWYDGGEGFGDELMDTTLRALDRLERDIGATVVDPVTVYVYANSTDLRSALQSNEVEWIGGLNNAELGIILATIPAGNRNEMNRILPHELSHQVLHQATENPYGGVPLWFNEGLAVHNQEYHEIGFRDLVDDAARAGELIPLAALSSSFPPDPLQARLSYAQSYQMVSYLLDVYGTGTVEELVEMFALATPLEEAMQQVLEMSVDELDAEWQATLPPAEVERAPVIDETPSAPPSRFSEPPVVHRSDGAVSNVSATVPPPIVPQSLTSAGIFGLALGTTSCLIQIMVIAIVVFVRMQLLQRRRD